MPRGPILIGLLALALLGGGCGGTKSKEAGDQSAKSPLVVSDPFPHNRLFHIGADASDFAGVVPLKVLMGARAFHASGRVLYRWRFDDGTRSSEQNPRHTFSKPGYYQVLMVAADTKGHSDSYNLIFSAWPRKYRSAEQHGFSPQQQRRLIRELGRATAKRRQKYPLHFPPLPIQNPPK
jgi:hypothetical protein